MRRDPGRRRPCVRGTTRPAHPAPARGGHPNCWSWCARWRRRRSPSPSPSYWAAHWICCCTTAPPAPAPGERRTARRRDSPRRSHRAAHRPVHRRLDGLDPIARPQRPVARRAGPGPAPFSRRCRDRLDLNASDAGAAPAARAALAASLLTPAGALVALAVVDVWVAVCVLTGLPFLALVLRAFARDTGASVGAYQRVQSDIASRLLETMEGAETIAAAGTAARERERVLGPLAELGTLGTRMWRLHGRALATGGVLVPLLTVAATAVGGLRLGAGALSVGELLAVCRYAQLAAGFGGAATLVGALVRGRRARERTATLERLPALAYGTRTLAPGGPDTLELHDVRVLRGGDGSPAGGPRGGAGRSDRRGRGTQWRGQVRPGRRRRPAHRSRPGRGPAGRHTARASDPLLSTCRGRLRLRASRPGRSHRRRGGGGRTAHRVTPPGEGGCSPRGRRSLLHRLRRGVRHPARRRPCPAASTNVWDWRGPSPTRAGCW